MIGDKCAHCAGLLFLIIMKQLLFLMFQNMTSNFKYLDTIDTTSARSQYSITYFYSTTTICKWKISTIDDKWYRPLFLLFQVTFEITETIQALGTPNLYQPSLVQPQRTVLIPQQLQQQLLPAAVNTYYSPVRRISIIDIQLM
jgi:hypothetical protein